MAEEDAEDFELELQALVSVYGGDNVHLKRDEISGHVIEIVAVVRPATCEDVAKQYLSIEVVFSIPLMYPAVAPAISFRNPRGLGEDEIDRLSRELESFAEDNVGTEMLLPLIDAVKDCLTTHNTKPHGQCCICLEDFAPDEGITRTLCAHCLHSHCLSDYVAHAIKEHELPVDPKKKQHGSKTATNVTEDFVFPCPVCREPMQPLSVSYLRKQAPPAVKPASEIDIHRETLRFQQIEIFNQLRLAQEARLAEEEAAKKAAVEAIFAPPAVLTNGESMPTVTPSEDKRPGEDPGGVAPVVKEVKTTLAQTTESNAAVSNPEGNSNRNHNTSNQHYDNYNRRRGGYYRYNPSNESASQRETLNYTSSDNVARSGPPRRQQPDNRNREENYYYHPRQQQRHYNQYDRNNEGRFQDYQVQNSNNGPTSTSRPSTKSERVSSQKQVTSDGRRPPPDFEHNTAQLAGDVQDGQRRPPRSNCHHNSNEQQNPQPSHSRSAKFLSGNQIKQPSINK